MEKQTAWLTLKCLSVIHSRQTRLRSDLVASYTTLNPNICATFNCITGCSFVYKKQKEKSRCFHWIQRWGTVPSTHISKTETKLHPFYLFPQHFLAHQFPLSWKEGGPDRRLLKLTAIFCQYEGMLNKSVRIIRATNWTDPTKIFCGLMDGTQVFRTTRRIRVLLQPMNCYWPLLRWIHATFSLSWWTMRNGRSDSKEISTFVGL